MSELSAEPKKRPSLLPWVFAATPVIGAVLWRAVTQATTQIGVIPIAGNAINISAAMHFAGLPISAFVAMSAHRQKKHGLAAFAIFCFLTGCLGLMMLFGG